MIQLSDIKNKIFNNEKELKLFFKSYTKDIYKIYINIIMLMKIYQY